MIWVYIKTGYLQVDKEDKKLELDRVKKRMSNNKI